MCSAMLSLNHGSIINNYVSSISAQLLYMARKKKVEMTYGQYRHITRLLQCQEDNYNN